MAEETCHYGVYETRQSLTNTVERAKFKKSLHFWKKLFVEQLGINSNP